jgi:hypothetical protein
MLIMDIADCVTFAVSAIQFIKSSCFERNSDLLMRNNTSMAIFSNNAVDCIVLDTLVVPNVPAVVENFVKPSPDSTVIPGPVFDVSNKTVSVALERCQTYSNKTVNCFELNFS